MIAKLFDLHLGDCLEVMRDLEANSIDTVLCDLPYGTTQNAWDNVIDLEAFWREVRRLSKPKANWVMFGAQPFTTDLINSNRKAFRYAMVWPKTTPTGFLNANRRPLAAHEDVLIFGEGQGVYNPQKWESNRGPYSTSRRVFSSSYGGQVHTTKTSPNGERFPITVLPETANKQANAIHSTQKPDELCSYLILTYSNEGDLVADFTMGSGTTGIAAAKTGRRFVGIELSPEYYEIAKARIEAAYRQAHLFAEGVV